MRYFRSADLVDASIYGVPGSEAIYRTVGCLPPRSHDFLMTRPMNKIQAIVQCLSLAKPELAKDDGTGRRWPRPESSDVLLYDTVLRPMVNKTEPDVTDEQEWSCRL